MKIAVCQSSVTGDIAANGASIRALLGEAADHGARLAVFCETALSGFVKDHISTPDDWSRYDWPLLERECAAIGALCRERGIVAAFGTAHRFDADRPPHNSLLVIGDDGAIVARYDKRFLSHSELQGWYTPGEGMATFEVDGYQFGAAICIETQFPELFGDHERMGVDAILFPSMSMPAFFQTSTLAHAGHNCLWIAAATCAEASGQGTGGLAGPNGKWLARCGEGETLAIAEIARSDPKLDVALTRARPWRAAARRGDIYRAAKG